MRKHLSNARFKQLMNRKLLSLEKRLEKLQAKGRPFDAYRIVTDIMFLLDDWAVDQDVKRKRK